MQSGDDAFAASTCLAGPVPENWPVRNGISRPRKIMTMARKGQNFIDRLKERASPKALQGDRTVQEIAVRDGSLSTQMSAWKRRAAEGPSGVFSGPRAGRWTATPDWSIRPSHCPATHACLYVRENREVGGEEQFFAEGFQAKSPVGTVGTPIFHTMMMEWRERHIAIGKDLQDRLPAGRDGPDRSAKNGLVGELKKALSERLPNTELDEHLVAVTGRAVGNCRNGASKPTPDIPRGRPSLQIPSQSPAHCPAPHVHIHERGQ